MTDSVPIKQSRTYKRFVEILSDVLHQFGLLASGQDGVQCILLDVWQDTGRMTDTDDLLDTVGQLLNQVVHGNVRWRTGNHLEVENE